MMQNPLPTFIRTACILLLATVPVGAATYYVSPDGNDGNSGTSTTAPWKTIARINGVNLGAGDQVLFEGNRTFLGSIEFKWSGSAQDRGTASNPVVFSSYGTGRATIAQAAAGSPAFDSYNTSGVEIRDLNFVGLGRDVSTSDGIKFYVDGGGMVRHPHVVIEQVDVSGFALGLSIGGWGESGGIRYGIDGISIQNVTAFDNRDIGIFVWGQKRTSHTDLVVRDSVAHHNRGNAAATTNTGNGILVNGVTGGLVEHCRAYANGDIGFGSVGIWTYGVDGITIQFCESYDNRASRTSDGGGFDFDGGTINSVMQYNYSHGNDGAGYLLAQYNGADAEFGVLSNNVVRYNVSENDGRRRSYGGIMFWGANSTNQVGTTYVYGNTVYMGGTVTDGSPSCVRFLGGNFSGLMLYNNLFYAANGRRIVNADNTMATSKVLFNGNNYFPATGTTLQVKWGSTTHTTLAGWLAAASGQEPIHGGLSIDPMLTNPGGGGTIGDTTMLANLSAYKLLPNSPMLNAGLDLPNHFASASGIRDYFGNVVPRGPTLDIGAHEGDSPPWIAATATATPMPVGQTAATLVVLGEDDAAETNLIYTWEAIGVPPGPVTFGGNNGSNSAQTTTATFTHPGSYTLRATITDLTGQSVTSNVAISVEESLPLWRARYFTEDELTDESRSGPLADYLGDGIPNLIKYALGVPPSLPGADALPTAKIEGGELVMVYDRDTSRADIRMHVATSDTLQPTPWTATGVTEIETGTNGTVKTIRASVDIGTSSHRFLRLVVSHLP